MMEFHSELYMMTKLTTAESSPNTRFANYDDNDGIKQL